MADGPFTCSLDAVLFIAGGKWKPLILYHLWPGQRRYGELRRAVGRASDKMLIQQLKELVADGIVSRVDHGEIPPRVEYSLTALGTSLSQALTELGEWGTRHSDELQAILARRFATARAGEGETAGGDRRLTTPPPRAAPR